MQRWSIESEPRRGNENRSVGIAGIVITGSMDWHKESFLKVWLTQRRLFLFLIVHFSTDIVMLTRKRPAGYLCRSDLAL